MPSDDFLALNPGYKAPKQKTKRGATLPTAEAGTRAPNGWVADYEEAIKRGWSFATDGRLCWAWKGKEETTKHAYLGDYATAAGVYRLAVEECLKHG